MEKEPSLFIRLTTLILCFVECIVFAGNFASWSILVYVLKQDGVFIFLCDENNTNTISNETSTNNSYGLSAHEETMFTTYETWHTNNRSQGVLNVQNDPICKKQDSSLSLAFTIGIVTDGVLSFPIGWLLDRHGLRITRCIASVLATAAYLLLGLAGPDELSWLVYPGCICLSLSCHIIIMTNCHACGLAGRHASKVMSLFNGAVNADISFLLIKIAAVNGFARLYGFVVLLSLWTIVLVTTFFLLPVKHVINSYNTRQDEISKFETTEPTKTSQRDAGSLEVCASTDTKAIVKRSSCCRPLESLRETILSTTYLLFLFWFNILFLRMAWFMNTYNAWLTNRVNGDLVKVNYYTNMYGYFRFGNILVAPLAGAYIDHRRKHLQAKKNPSHFDKAVSTVPSLTMTSLLAVILGASSLLDDESAIYATLISVEVFKAFLFATAVSLIEIVYPPLMYGKLLGLKYAASAAVNFCMYPMTSWAESSQSGFNEVDTFLLVLAGTTLVFPVFIFISHQCHAYQKRKLQVHLGKPTDPLPTISYVYQKKNTIIHKNELSTSNKGNESINHHVTHVTKHNTNDDKHGSSMLNRPQYNFCTNL